MAREISKEKKIETIKTNIKLWNKYAKLYRQIHDLSGVDLSGHDLSGVDLRDADLSNADLSNAQIQWSNLSGANLSGANVNKTNLFGTDLSNSNLENVDFQDAVLSNVSLRGANLHGVDFSGAKLDNLAGIPLGFKSQSFTIDREQAMQIIAHIFAAECDNPEYNELREQARKFCKKSYIAKYMYWLK